ncbi:MAG: tRNA (adenosine(37)-N6)-dimethylallyltransferase MiaA [Candidatus Neomarinimicrobiota bacterium]
MEIKKNKIITVIGSTGSGKTYLAVKLAKELDAEVISLDSRQIYKGMEIGTAQPTEEEMENIPHHLIGISSPTESISAGTYAELVLKKVQIIQDNGKVPIICGGAGLYYRAIKGGIFQGSRTDNDLRIELERVYDKDPSSLMRDLISIDPVYADIVHINNKRRLVRALEIFHTTGRAPSENFNQQDLNSHNYLNLFTIRLDWERDNLIKRISLRLEKMLLMGWIQEVNKLLEKQIEKSLCFPALNSIGYKQIQSYLNEEISYDDMKENIIIKTRQFAKRQKQWFNKEDADLIIKMDNLEQRQMSQILHCLFKVII